MAHAYSLASSPWRSPLAPLFSALVAGCAPNGGSTSASADPSSSPPGGDCFYTDDIILSPDDYELWSMGQNPEWVDPTTGTTGAAPDSTDSGAASTSTDSGASGSDSGESGTTGTASTGDGASSSGGVVLDDMQICRLVCQNVQSDSEYATELSSCSITPTDKTFVVTCQWPASCGGRGHACIGSRGAGDGRDAGARWLARAAHDEAASVVAFAALADELARLGAPAEMLAALAEAARDEQRHAAQVIALAQRRGADIVAPRIADVPARDLLALAVENAVEGCVHETWAALVAAHQARAAHDPALRAAFAEIAADEARHADLAWAIDAWLSEQLDEAARAEVAAARRSAVRALATGLAEAPEHAELVALGLPSPRVALQLCAGLDAALWSQAA
jgi:rubrerythrin